MPDSWYSDLSIFMQGKRVDTALGDIVKEKDEKVSCRVAEKNHSREQTSVGDIYSFGLQIYGRLGRTDAEPSSVKTLPPSQADQGWRLMCHIHCARLATLLRQSIYHDEGFALTRQNNPKGSSIRWRHVQAFCILLPSDKSCLLYIRHPGLQHISLLFNKTN